MRYPRALLVTVLLATLAGCGPNMGAINANPAKYYEDKVTIRARVSRREDVDDQALLELADGHERRILALVDLGDAPAIGDWVRVRGVLVADRGIGDEVVYDVIVVEKIEGARAGPWWRPW